MVLIRTILSIPLLAFGVLGITGNIILILRGIAGRRRGSLIPIPGVFAAVGMLISPFCPVQRCVWIPLVADPSVWATVSVLGMWSWRRLTRRN